MGPGKFEIFRQEPESHRHVESEMFKTEMPSAKVKLRLVFIFLVTD